jgi:hypothetical protein
MTNSRFLGHGECLFAIPYRQILAFWSVRRHATDALRQVPRRSGDPLTCVYPYRTAKSHFKLAHVMGLPRLITHHVRARAGEQGWTDDQMIMALVMLVETFKTGALSCYKKFKAYQPLNVYWAEQGLMLFSEFRDGNVPADYDLLRPFKQVYLRSDTTGYIIDSLKYCAGGKNERFGVIDTCIPHQSQSPRTLLFAAFARNAYN